MILKTKLKKNLALRFPKNLRKTLLLSLLFCFSLVFGDQKNPDSEVVATGKVFITKGAFITVSGDNNCSGLQIIEIESVKKIPAPSKSVSQKKSEKNAGIHTEPRKAEYHPKPRFRFTGDTSDFFFHSSQGKGSLATASSSQYSFKHVISMYEAGESFASLLVRFKNLFSKEFFIISLHFKGQRFHRPPPHVINV